MKKVLLAVLAIVIVLCGCSSGDSDEIMLSSTEKGVTVPKLPQNINDDDNTNTPTDDDYDDGDDEDDDGGSAPGGQPSQPSGGSTPAQETDAAWEGCYTACGNTVTITKLVRSLVKDGVVTIPAKIAGKDVTDIAMLTFSRAEMSLGVEEYKVDGGSVRFSASDGVLFNKDKTELIRFPKLKKCEAYTVPKGVKAIKDYAFNGCCKLKTLEAEKGSALETIGKESFSNCSVLVSADFSNATGLKAIGEKAFVPCITLTTFKVYDKNIIDVGSGALPCNMTQTK